MALMPCGGCRRDVSSMAAACARCGHPVPRESPTAETLRGAWVPDLYSTWALPLARLVALAASWDAFHGGQGPLTSLPLVMGLAVIVRVARVQAGFRPLAAFCVASWALAGLAHLWFGRGDEFYASTLSNLARWGPGPARTLGFLVVGGPVLMLLAAAAALHADLRLLGFVALWQVAMAALRRVSGVPAVVSAPLMAAAVVTLAWGLGAGVGVNP